MWEAGNGASELGLMTGGRAGGAMVEPCFLHWLWAVKHFLTAQRMNDESGDGGRRMTMTMTMTTMVVVRMEEHDESLGNWLSIRLPRLGLCRTCNT